MLKKVFDFFVFTSLFIACCAVLMVYQAFLLFGVQFPLALYGFVFFGSVCSYNFHWFLTPPQIPGTSHKQQWNLNNRPLHLLLSITGLIGAAICSFLLIDHWLWLAITAFLTFLYSAPMIPLRPFIWLRKIAIAKTIYLAFAWAHITASLPLLIVQDRLSAEHAWYLANRFFFIYAICIVFDRRDVESDRKAGIRSLITWLDEKGVDRLFWVSQFMVLATTVVLTRWLSFTEAILLLVPALIMGLLYNASKQNRSDYLYYFLLDGLMALSAPLLILLRFAR
ncbi:MAG TPA: UbiA family prenyltransferase [Flavisolibacter sp.]|nr:UbiA family prenyltransferase [Flavisolibacter sp.]